MKFGTVPNPGAVRFGPLPATRRIGATGRAGDMRLFFGAPVWGDKAWVGNLYPEKTRSRDFLKVYSRRLNAVELNSTFYSVPPPGTVESWRDQVPSDFRFSPKFHQGISHAPVVPPREVLAFCDVMRLLEVNLGVAFLQLPDRVSPGQYDHVERLVRHIPRDFEVAVEFRHPAWFAGGQLAPAAARLLERYGRYAVVTDTPGRRDVLHGTVVGNKALVRFSGSDGHPSDLPRLDHWARKLAEWRADGVEEAYFYLHSPNGEHIPELISNFVAAANRHGFALRDWRDAHEPGEQIAMGF